MYNLIWGRERDSLLLGSLLGYVAIVWSCD